MRFNDSTFLWEIAQAFSSNIDHTSKVHPVISAKTGAKVPSTRTLGNSPKKMSEPIWQYGRLPRLAEVLSRCVPCSFQLRDPLYSSTCPTKLAG